MQEADKGSRLRRGEEKHPEAQEAWLTGLMRTSHKPADGLPVQAAPLRREEGKG